MRDPQSLSAMRAALQFAMSSDIPAEHKVVIIDSLTRSLREQESAEQSQRDAAEAGAPWLPEEVTELEHLLGERTARNWQHADELLMHVAAQLHRSPSDVRATAIRLGFGAAVDYAVARNHPHSGDRP